MMPLNSYEPIDFKDYSGSVLLNSSAIELLKMVSLSVICRMRLRPGILQLPPGKQHEAVSHAFISLSNNWSGTAEAGTRYSSLPTTENSKEKVNGHMNAKERWFNSPGKGLELGTFISWVSSECARDLSGSRSDLNMWALLPTDNTTCHPQGREHIPGSSCLVCLTT